MRSSCAALAVVVLLAGGGSGGCGGTVAPPAAPLPAAGRAMPSGDPLPDREWGVVESARFFVSVPLPDRSAWRVDDSSGRWLVATHLPSKSVLLVRGWRAGSVVGHGACEAEARPWRVDLFGRDESALVDRRALSSAPAGFDTEVGFSVRRSTDALGGVAIAALANVRRCLILAYVTRADGPDAPRAVAERLAFITERVFARIETRAVDDRVVPAARR